MLFLLSLLSFTADTSPPTLLLSQVIFNSFSEATGSAGGQGQDTASSLCCSFFLTRFPHTSMGPLWVVVLSGKYLLQCGLLYGSFVGWSSFQHEEHPFHLLSLVFLLMFLTVSFFPFFLCLCDVLCSFTKTFPERGFQLCWWAQLCPCSSPLQSQLELYVSGMRQPLAFSQRGHLCSS